MEYNKNGSIKIALVAAMVAAAVAVAAVMFYRAQSGRSAGGAQTASNATGTVGSGERTGQTPGETSGQSQPMPEIKVLSPKSGDVFSSQTDQIGFSWNWSGVAKTVTPLIQLLDENGNEVYGKLGGSGTTYSDNGGQGQIPAPASLVIPEGRAQYRVRICTSRAKTNCGAGDYFTIVKTASAATDQKVILQVVAPKSGEVLEAGQQYTIKWKNTGLPAGAVQTIMVMNGTKGVVEEPSITIAKGLAANINSYSWTVEANKSWSVGLENDPWRTVIRLLGIETAYADLNQYVIRISANAPGVLGEVGLGVSDPFTINQPELEKACTEAGGTWDEPNILCECPKHFYWYAGHGCLPDQGEENN